MNILITGAAGFIGSSLVDRLIQTDNYIIGLDNYDPFYSRKTKESNLAGALKYSNFELIEGDIRDSSLLDRIFQGTRIDAVVHLAAKAGVRNSIERPLDYISVNIHGTCSILEKMKQYGVTKMVFASSSSVYGNNCSLPFTESAKTDSPISPYAASKIAGESLCYTYHDMYKFDIYCLRFFTVFGPRQRPDLAIHKFANILMQNGEIELYGDGSTSRDYTYISDIVDGIVSAIFKVSGFEIFNLGGTSPVTLAEMLKVLEKAFSIEANICFKPKQLGDVEKTFADITKAKGLLRYEPKIQFYDGIEKFVRWKLS